jgi:hypothetical protein
MYPGNKLSVGEGGNARFHWLIPKNRLPKRQQGSVRSNAI